MTAARPLKVLVLGVGGNVSQGILKALKRGTIPCHVVGADVSAQQFGLYTTDAARVSPWAADANFVPWLVDCCKEDAIDVILTGTEPILAVLTHQRAAIEAATGASLIVSPPRVEAIGEDKLLTCQWLEENGFPAPAYAASEDPGAVARLRRDHAYPLVAKPRSGGGARGLFLAENEDDLAYVQRKPNYVIQEYIGDAEHEYTVGVFSRRDASIAGAIVMRRELLAGTTYRATVEDAPAIRDAAVAITEALQPTGPCNIQMRLGKQGPICFEINPRFSGTTPLRAALGFNEVDAALRHFVLGEALPDLPRIVSGVALRYWNELYPDMDALWQLEADGKSDHPGTTRGVMEDYGRP